MVEVTAHSGARPEHAEWQGKIYSRSGKSKKYPDLVEATGYGTGPGLGGWNCRHSMFPYYEGMGRVYTDEELEELKPNKENDIIDIDRLEIDGLTSEGKKSLKNACNKILQHGLKNGTETMLCIDKNNGKNISEMLTGNKNSVKFSQELISDLLLAQKNSIVMIHNHPSSSSFSPEDIRSLLKFDSVSDIVVIGHDKTMYSLSLANGANIKYEILKEDYYRLKNEKIEKYINKIKNGEITKKEAWYEHSNEILNDLSEFYKWKYWRYKN